MTRRAFYSFHYEADAWRAAQVRNMGVVDGNVPVHDNTWEEVKRGGDNAIKRWIDNQLHGRSVTIVLIGAGTAGRKWINYEICQSWDNRKGILGIHIHNLRDANGYASLKGSNPFAQINVGTTPLSMLGHAYDPSPSYGQSVYDNIKANLPQWIEDAISIRNQYT